MNENAAAFEEDPAKEDASGGFVLFLDEFEGPIDLLLTLARRQKIDLAKISILRLAEQYLEYIEHAKQLDFEIAAEYLVMAAWLAHMKSRILLPDDEEATEDELTHALTHRLKRLDAMRTAGENLFRRPLLGHDRHIRGAVEVREERVDIVLDASFHDLVGAYADVCRRKQPSVLTLEPASAYSMEIALTWIRERLTDMKEWTTLAGFLPRKETPFARRSALASILSASLEMTREGAIDLRQDVPFGPVLIRTHSAHGTREIPNAI